MVLTTPLIAVAGATDAARAAADIVLTQSGLHTIIHGIILSREIFARINSFITYRVAATLQLLWFLFIAAFIESLFLRLVHLSFQFCACVGDIH
jgi:P-type E1-E2 ATPase